MRHLFRTRSTPLRGALLVSNPRKAGKIPLQRLIARLKNGAKRKNRVRGRRRNGIGIRTNGIGIRTNRARKFRFNSRKRRTGGRRRRNGTMLLRANPTFLVNRRRRKGARRNRRRNGLGVRTNPTFLVNRRKRRKGARRHNRCRNGLAFARRTNGFHFKRKNRKGARRRRNGIGIRTNPLKMVTGLARKIPFVGGTIAKYLGPALAGAAGLLGISMILKYGMPYVPAQIAEYVSPVAYTLAGVAIATAAAFVPSRFLGTGTKALIASSVVTAGAAMDAAKYIGGGDAMAGIGDGGLWALGGSSDYGDADSGALAGEYADAEPGDAADVSDLDVDEMSAAAQGPRAWKLRFPFIRRLQRRMDGRSRHAGSHGHRWGWLIRLIGFDQFSKLAQQPDQVRKAYIQQLRQQAVALLPSQSALGGLVLAQ